MCQACLSGNGYQITNNTEAAIDECIHTQQTACLPVTRRDIVTVHKTLQ